MTRTLFLACLCGITVAALPIHGEEKPAASDTVVARVNDNTITRGKLNEAVEEATQGLTRMGDAVTPEQRTQIEKQVLDQLIGQELMIEKSKSIQVPEMEAKVKEQIDKAKQMLGDEKAYEAQLQQMNLTEASLKEKIAEGLRMKTLIDQQIRSKIDIADNEIKQFYDAHPEYFAKPAEVRASHILVQVPEKADDKVKAEKKAAIDKAHERVTKGEDFAKVASEVSEDPGSKGQGGDLGYFGPGRMVPEFEKAAFALKTNEISPVVTSKFGYHIIKVTDNKPPGTVSLDQSKEGITQFLTQQKVQQGLMAYIERLKKDAKVEVLLK